MADKPPPYSKLVEEKATAPPMGTPPVYHPPPTVPPSGAPPAAHYPPSAPPPGYCQSPPPPGYCQSPPPPGYCQSPPPPGYCQSPPPQMVTPEAPNPVYTVYQPQPAMGVVLAAPVPPNVCIVCRVGMMRKRSPAWAWVAFIILIPFGLLPGFCVLCLTLERTCTNCGYTP